MLKIRALIQQGICTQQRADVKLTAGKSAYCTGGGGVLREVVLARCRLNWDESFRFSNLAAESSCALPFAFRNTLGLLGRSLVRCADDSLLPRM
jgi:hypothetical protein